MEDIGLTEQHDLELVDGDLSLVSEAIEVLQAIRIRILAIQTESVYDYTIGPPWLDEMFNPSVPRIVKEGYLKKIILETPGVLSLDKFIYNIDRINKGVVIEIECRTIYSSITGVIEV